MKEYIIIYIFIYNLKKIYLLNLTYNLVTREGDKV